VPGFEPVPRRLFRGALGDRQTVEVSLELNPAFEHIDDMRQRLDALRGYL